MTPSKPQCTTLKLGKEKDVKCILCALTGLIQYYTNSINPYNVVLQAFFGLSSSLTRIMYNLHKYRLCSLIESVCGLRIRDATNGMVATSKKKTVSSHLTKPIPFKCFKEKVPWDGEDNIFLKKHAYAVV